MKDTCPIKSRKKRVVIAEVNTPVKIFNIAPILILWNIETPNKMVNINIKLNGHKMIEN